jgi:glyoxylate/hydroxypyruvate reductase A
MAILFTANDYTRPQLAKLVVRFLGDLAVRVWPDIGHPDEIDYIVATGTAPTAHFQNLPNLKAIFLAAAGVDAIINDPDLPAVPIVRCVNDSLSSGMAEYVVYHVLKYHRNFHLFNQQQIEHTWKQARHTPTADRVVGIMGVGEMGLACIDALKPFGFPLRGWSRTPKDINGVTHFAGLDALPDFLAGCSIVVCVLPLTDETRGILSRDNLQHLPHGAFLINAGRGGHMSEADIIALLNDGHLAAATLDVFPVEPLPVDHPLWSHPKVTITPHIASITDYAALCADIRAQIIDFENGKPLRNLVDRERGY